MTKFKQLIAESKAENKTEIAITVHNRKEFKELCKASYELNFERKNCHNVPKELDDCNIPTDIIIDLSTTKEIEEMKQLFQSL